MSDGPQRALHGEVARAVAWVALDKWTGRAITLGVFAILTRLVTPEQFGLVSLAMTVVSFITVFVDAGFSKALIQREKLDERDADTAFWLSVVSAVFLGAVVAVLSPLIASLLGEPELTPLLLALSIAFPLAALSAVPAALLERTIDFKSLSIRQLIGTAAGALVAIPLALSGFGAWALVGQTLVSLLASAAVLWFATSWRPRFRFSWSSLRRMWPFAGSFLGVELLNAVQMNADKLLIGALLGPTMLGYYYVGQRALNILTELIASIIGRVSLTTFSRIQDDNVRTVRVLKKLVFVSGAIALPVFGIAACLAPQIVPFLFGGAWGATVAVFQALAPSAALNSITALDKNVLMASGHHRAALLIGVVQSTLGIALLLLAMPLGIVAVALSRSLLAVVMLPIRITTLRLKIRLDVGGYLWQITACLIAVIPAGALIVLLQETTWASSAHAFFSFALPVATMALLLYAAILLLVCGRSNRTVIFGAARTVLQRRRG